MEAPFGAKVPKKGRKVNDMKRLKKALALALALTVVMAYSAVGAFAAGKGTIKINPPSGLQDTDTNVYKIYKVFDADGNGTNISYKLCSGDTLSADMTAAGFSVDSSGNVKGPSGNDLTAEAIAAIAKYVTDEDLVDTVNATGKTAVTSKQLDNGYYYITTSTGTAVTINSTNPNVTVNDKNTVPGLTKVISAASSYDADGKKALAQIGTDVEFTSTITVGKGMKGYVFHDKMSSGLTLKADTIDVTYSEKPDGYGTETVKTGEAAENDTIVIEFPDGLAEGTTITIKYKATINELALEDDPENNTAYVKYGNEDSNNKTPNEETKVWNAQIGVKKYDGAKADDKPLEGAGFKLKNSEGKYYHLEGTVVSWVDKAAGDEHVSNGNGTVPAFTGLADGAYTLEETTIPSGYTKATDKTITIAASNYTNENLSQTAEVENQKGTPLPTTGGIGTTIFYIVGAILVVGAGILLISRRRMQAK
jgi:fimbrial isopeptide formation D2 family protein/LPXTG-motif cell wall-anchored protein